MIRNYLRRLYRTLLPLLYGRSKFKLFLNAAVGDIRLRMLTLASVTDTFAGFVRAIPIEAPFGKSVLVVAPHQDDEAIGCGGALALHVASGRDAAVVILQDGAGGCEELGMTRRQLMDIRNEESRQAAAAIGLTSLFFLNYPDLRASTAEASERVRRILIERRVDALFVPWVLDGHPDHRTANIIVAKALEGIQWDVRVFGYEVWGMCVPNVLVIIDEVIDKKCEMISRFRFANQALDYVNSTKGLNMFHSRMLGAGECRYAERFFEAPREEYIDLVKRIEKAEAENQRPT